MSAAALFTLTPAHTLRSSLFCFKNYNSQASPPPFFYYASPPTHSRVLSRESLHLRVRWEGSQVSLWAFVKGGMDKHTSSVK